MSFSIFNSNIVLCTNNQILIYNFESKVKNVISIPKLVIEKEIKAHNKEDIESFHTLTSIVYSNDGQYFLVCANRKQLCLFKSQNAELLSSRILTRAASKVKFLPNNDIVVADKSGDAYLFSTSNPNENGQLLLGHLSMLLDILVTDDEKFVITADRDEKIRISMFPNSYNILSYCLGHKNFVTNVALVPHDKNILTSSGGDGTLIFWDFKTGKELVTIYFHEKLSEVDLIKVNKTLKENDLDDQVSVSPVNHLRLLQINQNKSICALTFYCSNVLLIYNVLNEQNNLIVEYLESLSITEEPLEIQCQEKRLWILTNFGIQVYKFQENSFDIDKSFNVQELNEFWKSIHSETSLTLLPVLYKRKFDSVQEYQERKKSRLQIK